MLIYWYLDISSCFENMGYRKKKQHIPAWYVRSGYAFVSILTTNFLFRNELQKNPIDGKQIRHSTMGKGKKKDAAKKEALRERKLAKAGKKAARKAGKESAANGGEEVDLQEAIRAFQMQKAEQLT